MYRYTLLIQVPIRISVLQFIMIEIVSKYFLSIYTLSIIHYNWKNIHTSHLLFLFIF